MTSARPDDPPWAEWEPSPDGRPRGWTGPGHFAVYPPVPVVPAAVQLGHAASLVWASLWVLAGLRASDTSWGGLVAAVGGLMALLVLVARFKSARAWLLLQVLTVVLLVVSIGSLFAEPGEAGAAPPASAPPGSVEPAFSAGDEDPVFVALTATLQATAVVSLNWRSSRTWHGVDPPGWRTFFDR